MNLLNTKAGAYAVVTVIAGVALYLVAKKLGGAAADAAQAVGDAVNPTKDTNLAYRATNAVGSALTGDDSFSLGGWFYDITHPGEAASIRSTPPFAPRATQVREEASWFDSLLGSKMSPN
jgi:hypothetical protein